MQVIKEYVGKLCIIRTNTYSHDLDHFLKLFQEAQKDFPFLTKDKVNIIHYAGKFYSGTFGIEFTVTGKIPATYTKKNYVEKKF